jgi:hypothetical protein
LKTETRVSTLASNKTVRLYRDRPGDLVERQKLYDSRPLISLNTKTGGPIGSYFEIVIILARNLLAFCAYSEQGSRSQLSSATPSSSGNSAREPN